MKLKIYQHTHVTYSKWSRVEFKHSSSINLNQFFFKLKLQTFKHPHSSTCIFLRFPPLSSGITSGPVQPLKIGIVD